MSRREEQLEEDKDEDVLPVEQYSDDILQAVRENPMVICVGETGSGKTTKLPQFLLDSGLAGDKMVAVTQPRRVAATSVAARVAQERHTRLGDEVGYTIRFDDCTSPRTRIRYMTDGSLVRECLTDPLLEKYGVIMLDEAHERSIHTDILFALVKQCVKRRSDLKLVVTSATLDAERFSAYFDNCPVFNVPGRIFPVEIYHSKTKQIMTTSGPATDSYIQAAVDVIMKIHSTQGEGHILVFLTGQEEIEKACDLLRKGVQQLDRDRSHNPTSRQDDGVLTELRILPLYSALPADQQRRVFAKVPRSVRKCVVATNIAETSITVPHVRYVVDAGYVKQKVYNPQRGMESLVVVPISQVAAQQRAGRAGRTGPGQVYRLYSKECYAEMMHETVPEIKRTNLANTVLYLKTLGIHDVIGFDYLEPPSEDLLVQALRLLHQLGGLDDDGNVTPLGKQMAQFPLDPSISRMLIQASEENCLNEVLTIAAMLSADNIWYSRRTRRGERDEEAEAAHASLRHPKGDHFTFLHLYEQWIEHGCSDEWCTANFVRRRALMLAKRVRAQLADEAEKLGLRFNEKKASDRRISKAICAGFFYNAARRCVNESVFRSLPMGSEDVKLMHLHPQSALAFVRPPEYVVYQELVYTAKPLMHNVVEVDVNWLQTCRSRVHAVSPYRLSGRAEPVPAVREEEGKDSDDAPAQRAANPVLKRPHADKEAEERKQSELTVALQQDTTAAVSAARARFLARKKVKH